MKGGDGGSRWLTNGFVGSDWYAVFSFWIVLDVFWVWMMLMAAQVSRNSID